MKITLLHPSRGRAKKAASTLLYWLDRSSKKIEIEHILSVDSDDKEVELYHSQPAFKMFSKILVNVKKENNVVSATNNAARTSTGDILVYLSDDFKCPKDWDLHLKEMYINDKPILIKVDDCLQKFNVPVLTIPIMNRKLYETLGYFWHPGYASMFVDQHLYEICKKNNWLYNAAELKFPHEHCSTGQAERDETYIRSEANWNDGKALFEKHKQEGFLI